MMNAQERADAEHLIRTALAEDLGTGCDITSEILISPDELGNVGIVSRKEGVFCGGELIPLILNAIDPRAESEVLLQDGAALQPGSLAARLHGPVRALLTAERTILNFLTFLCGTASLTRRYVETANRPGVQILDTRKTVPGLRSLQKYAVRCGGGTNHRIGLYDAILVKDNHLAAWTANTRQPLAEAARHVRKVAPPGMVIQFEVDNLQQLKEILPECPTMILLDNMSNDQLREAVAIRDQLAPEVLLEASGGVNLETVAGIAATGIDRISVGALTHSAPALDLGFDWLS